jgi:hypothetical protein
MSDKGVVSVFTEERQLFIPCSTVSVFIFISDSLVRLDKSQRDDSFANCDESPYLT